MQHSNQKPFKVSLLTIGTEVSSGEIVNTNASWLADQLTSLNLQVIRHITVPDETSLMTQSLDICAQDSTLLIVTGGLGPTTDDFTRQVVASWTKLPLEFDQASWQQIVERLGRMNVPAADSNKQQCYFPKGSTIITNPAGTANAFICTHQDKTIVCLPGPPTEITAIWHAALEKIVKERFPSPQHVNLYYWHTIGISESQLGEIVEAALKGSGFITGYRPHIPYVDVKVWTPPHTLPSTDPYLLRLEDAIAHYTIARQNEDVCKLFFQAASAYRSISIRDAVTRGSIAQRLGSIEILPHVQVCSSYDAHTKTSISPAELEIIISPTGDSDTCEISIQTTSGTRSERIKYPRRVTKETQSRYCKYVTEMCFVTLLKLT